MTITQLIYTLANSIHFILYKLIVIQATHDKQLNVIDTEIKVSLQNLEALTQAADY